MMSCWPGDKTASVMTSWTTKGLNSRRRRRRFMEYRSFAWAATAVAADDRPRSLRRPTPAAPRKAKAASFPGASVASELLSAGGGGANTRKIYAKQMFVLRVIRTLTLWFK